MSLSRAPVFSCAHYYQAPTTSKRQLRRLIMRSRSLFTLTTQHPTRTLGSITRHAQLGGDTTRTLPTIAATQTYQVEKTSVVMISVHALKMPLAVSLLRKLPKNWPQNGRANVMNVSTVLLASRVPRHDITVTRRVPTIERWQG